MRQRIAEQAHNTVAEFLGDMTTHFGDGSRRGIEISADQVAPLLGIKLRGNRGRTDQVAEHDGEIATLAHSTCRGDRWCRGKGLFWQWGESDRFLKCGHS